jgi:hypothetical protein
MTVERDGLIQALGTEQQVVVVAVVVAVAVVADRLATLIDCRYR